MMRWTKNPFMFFLVKNPTWFAKSSILIVMMTTMMMMMMIHRRDPRTPNTVTTSRIPSRFHTSKSSAHRVAYVNLVFWLVVQLEKNPRKRRIGQPLILESFSSISFTTWGRKCHNGKENEKGYNISQKNEDETTLQYFFFSKHETKNIAFFLSPKKQSLFSELLQLQLQYGQFFYLAKYYI